MTNNSTSPIDNDILPYRVLVPLMIQTMLNTFIIVGGVVGNVFVIAIILRRKRMQTITNWFVFNLAISDVCIVTLVIPLGFSSAFINWPFGEMGCKLIPPILEHFAGVCVLTHTALSLARCLIVSTAMSARQITINHVRVAIVVIWLVAFLMISAPLMGFAGNMKTKHTNNLQMCVLKWISDSARLAYSIVAFLLTYITPMVITGISYVWIHTAVSNSIKHLYGHMSEEMLMSRRQKSRRMDAILMTMYILFAISTLPLQLFYLCSSLGLVAQNFWLTDFGSIFSLSVQSLFYMQVVWNPLVLFYMGEEYRKEIYKLPLCSCLFPNVKKKTSFIARGSFRGVLKSYRRRRSVQNERRLSNKSLPKSKRTDLLTIEFNNMKAESRDVLTNCTPINLITQEQTLHNEVRTLHNEEQILHNEEGTLHNEEGTLHNEEGTLHNKEKTLHNDEGTLHNEEKILHNKEEILHNEEGTLHNKEKTLHNEEGTLHNKEKILHNEEGTLHKKEKILHNEEQTLHNEEDILHNEEGILHNEKETLPEEEENLHSEEHILHKEDGILHNKDKTLHKERTLHNKEGTLHNKEGTLHEEERNLHNEEHILHEEEGTLHNERSLYNSSILYSSSTIESEKQIEVNDENNCSDDICERIDLPSLNNVAPKDMEKLPSAYYDDGTLMFFHDSTFGKVCLQYDNGRETEL